MNIHDNSLPFLALLHVNSLLLLYNLDCCKLMSQLGITDAHNPQNESVVEVWQELIEQSEQPSIIITKNSAIPLASNSVTTVRVLFSASVILAAKLLLWQQSGMH